MCKSVQNWHKELNSVDINKFNLYCITSDFYSSEYLHCDIVYSGI